VGLREDAADMKVILGIDPGSRITGYGLIKEAHD